ncbi:hypothetical protein [Streptomyces sp.]|uniref:hypothetical protein n=1 Tax=Streptomyces sp. TaxID=1931 RepID=UPI002D79F2BC|nr:hypothetical protein [Streptomyces sp.]HET6353390.1 hypothetical protein [Streptomyces sp.]
MRYRITTPVLGFTGISAGVNFTDGTAEVEIADGDTQTYNARALAYFRSQGYGIEELDGPEDAEPEPEEPDDDEPFDPSEHDVPDVLAHLADADEDEQARVIAAERDGKNRKTITEKGAAS